MADVNITDIYSSVGVTEDVEVALDLIINVFSSVGLTENSDLWVGYEISVLETVALTEFADMVNTFITLANGLFPAWLLSARFDTTLQLNEKIPVREGSGQFGSGLGEKIPTRSFTGAIHQDSISLTLSSVFPTWSADGQFGFRLSAISPTWGISSDSSMSSKWNLSKKIPLLIFGGTLYEEPTIQLNKPLYFWSFSGSMNPTEDRLVLGANIPGALLFAGSMYELDTFQLDAIISMRTLEASMYDPEFRLSGNIPIWVITALVSEAKPEVHPDSSITEDSFSGVLRYIRP